MEVPSAPTLRPTRRAWIVAGTLAAAVFLVFELAHAFVAVPLRELSSILAQALLEVAGFPITRHGTILSTPRATFDVVPACSGSTTLQVLLFFSIVWCGVHPRLTPGRRVLAIFMALPAAILANSVRVSALVAAGHAMGGEPDGFLHGLAGIAAFLLAMIGCFAITQRLASTGSGPGVRERSLAVALAGLLGFVGLPFFMWCLDNWGGSSLDRFGFVFVAGALGVGVWRWRREPADRSWEGRGTIVWGLSLLLLAAATLVEVNILKGFALILGFLGLALAEKGIRFALSMVPVAGVAYLGFPTVSYQMAVLAPWMWGAPAAFFAAKCVGSLLFLTLLGARFFRSAVIPSVSPPRRFLPVQLLLAALLAAFQAYYLGIARSTPTDMHLEISYLQGPWVGRDQEAPRSESDYFGRDRIWSRRYSRGEDIVDVLINSTGGDRHRAHPPAYCVSGAGWIAQDSETIDRHLGDGTRVPMTRLRLRNGGREMHFYYWFTNGTESRASFSGMLLEDTLRRLGGRRADWFTFRVMTTSGEPALESFLSSFHPRLASAVGGPARP